MNFVDTHCHIHDPEYGYDPLTVLENARLAGVTRMLCIGTTAQNSETAVNFVQDKENCFAVIGLHPHDAKIGEDDFELLTSLVSRPKVIAVGECGLDYFYNHSDKADQEKALRYQIELALSSQLPMVFHVREAFSDFWRIFDDYTGIRGVIHSFTATTTEVEDAMSRGLYIGLNGIMTFTKDQKQLDAAKAIPLERLLLETDSPFLTPTPKRGTVNEPANVRVVAEFLSWLREESLETLAESTTGNASSLFGI